MPDGPNNSKMVLKSLLIYKLLLTWTETSLKPLPLTENGSKTKSLTPKPILNGSLEDSQISTTPSSNLTSPDVKPTNSLLCNSKNIKMLSTLLLSLEQNSKDLKLLVNNQFSLKLMLNSPANFKNTNICLKLTPWTNSSNKTNPKVLISQPKLNTLKISLILKMLAPVKLT